MTVPFAAPRLALPCPAAVCRCASLAEEVERLGRELGAKEGEIREAKAAEQEFAAECERLDAEFARERQQLKVGGAGLGGRWGRRIRGSCQQGGCAGGEVLGQRTAHMFCGACG